MEIPTEYHAANFGEMVRHVKIGSGAKRKQRYYQLTRDGFALLVMGFTGKRVMAWKIKFLEAFNAMEADLRGEPQPESPALLEMTRIMRGMSKPALEGFLRMIKDDQPTQALDHLITYLETTLLDRGMARNQYEALRSVHRIATGLRDAEEPPAITSTRKIGRH